MYGGRKSEAADLFNRLAHAMPVLAFRAGCRHVLRPTLRSESAT
jgi:hypothetical protein